MRKIKVRIYVKEKIEIIEIIDNDNNALIKRHVAPLGSSFVDLVYSDFNSFSNQISRTYDLLKKIRNSDYPKTASEDISGNALELFIENHRNSIDLSNELQELMMISSSLTSFHIFYYIYSMYINNLIFDFKNNQPQMIDYKFLTHDSYVAQQLKAFAAQFINEFQIKGANSLTTKHDKFRAVIENNKDFETISIDLKLPSSEYTFFPEAAYPLDAFINDTPTLNQIIYPTNLTEIINFFVIQMIVNDTIFNKCNNCGRYFVLSGHKNTEYCDRIIEGTGHTCKEIGADARYRRVKNEDPIFKAYNKAYKTKNARIRYGKITRDEFNTWSKNARIMRDKCKNGEISLEDLTAWLNSDVGFNGL